MAEYNPYEVSMKGHFILWSNNQQTFLIFAIVSN